MGDGTEVKGTLIAIGGHEEKQGQRRILAEVARRAGEGTLIVGTFASEEPEEQWREYCRVFQELGVKRVEHLDAREREELVRVPRLELMDGATVVFFAGGDQARITGRFGGTALCERMREMYAGGGTIAGTSSGASVMSEVMMLAGETDQSNEVGGPLRVAPGLGLISGMIIDQHFAQRGRIGRLLGAVAQSPRLLGIGIDEDTAAVFEGQRGFRVLGSGAVYAVDGRGITYTNAAEGERQTLSVHGVRLDVLSDGDWFDLARREARDGEGQKKRP